MESRRMFVTCVLALFMGVVGLLSSCNHRKGEVPPGNRFLVDSTLIREFSKQNLEDQFRANTELLPLIKYGIRVYKITYRTTYVDGTSIVASGAVLIPTTDTPSPLVSYQHGTITITPTDEGIPPSAYPARFETALITLFAANGYVVAAPDYIGYGASKELRHPYDHAPSLASSSLDMLRAAKEFCARKNTRLNGKTFLTGYSEGGNATMALHKLIEERYPRESITASAPLAEGYHKSRFLNHVMNANENLSYLNYYLWVVNSYNWIYQINRPYTYYYQSPWAAMIQNDVFSNTNLNPSQLFTENFRRGILERTDNQLLNAFQDNDVYDWKPEAPMLLMHGTADDFVPFFNSQDAYDAMQAKGGNVTLFPIEGADHFSVLPAYFFKALTYFNGF